MNIQEKLDEIIAKSRDSTRYPYTYACDWLRMLGLADSRSEAARLYKDEGEAIKLAEKYIYYNVFLTLADEYKETLHDNNE